MLLKANLHFHTSDDHEHPGISYDAYRGIDRAAQLGFKVLAITLHYRFLYTKPLADYAAQKGILLVPGIELTMWRVLNNGHVVILNCDEGAEKIRTFKQLKDYKKEHPKTFILAVHPYHIYSSLGRHLERNIRLFDGIEISWFYSKLVNSNKKVEKVAKKYRLPTIATSDTHLIKYLNDSYCEVDARDFSINSVISALKTGKIVNFSKPQTTIGLIMAISKYPALNSGVKNRRTKGSGNLN